MSYFSLANRVPEISALEPRIVTRLYELTSRIPLVRTTTRRFVAGALSKGVTQGCALDLGTGPGHVVTELARRNSKLTMIGLDLAANMIERAQQQAVRHDLNGRAPWVQADGHLLPFADGNLDLVISSFALHHWQDPLAVMNEIARVLRPPRPESGDPGGRYYIADVCRDVNAFQRLVAYASIPAFSLPYGSYWGYGGYYESIRAGYTLDEAQTLLEQSALAPGQVTLDSTWFVPVLTIASRGSA
ncbi:MAG: methyltransferase domain-containing protein [Anaerolineae bacterium]|nr:methyltransferase domain-containing protein [Anaerolineae bacterium]